MKTGGRLHAAVLTSTALGCAAVLATATPAAADNGLGEKGHSRYVVSDKGTPVRVTTTVTVTNQVPPSGGRYSYWTGYALWLPNGATGLKAVSRGSTLPAKVATRRGLTFAEIDFPSQLLYGQSRTITVTYSVKGAPPRSKASGRVGPGFVAIDTYAPGDAGQATIDLESPRWLTLDVGEKFTEVTNGDTRVATITGGGTGGLMSAVSMRDISQSTSRKVTVGKATFTVQAFPGDRAWQTFVADRLPTTVTTLEKLTGQQWPQARTIITEDYSAQVYGWDGQFTTTGITVNETLDHALLAHELAHAWADTEHLDERWLLEGLAQELATQTTKALKAKDSPRPTVRPTQKGAFALNDWAWDSSSATAAEAYGYPASWRAVHELMAGVPAAQRPDVVRMLTSSHSVYDAAGDRSVATHASSWKQAYDAFEVEGGNRATKASMTTWVLGKGDASAIALRSTTRTAYAARDRADGDWAPPRGVRSAMYEWSFADATRELARTGELAAKAVAAQQAATRSGLPVTGVRHAYELAADVDDYKVVAAQLTAFTSQASRYAQLRADTDSPNPLARLGALVLRPAEPLADARAAVVKGDTKAADRALETATSRSSWSTRAGAAILLVLLLAGAGVALVVRRRTRRKAAPAVPVVDSQPAAPEPADSAMAE
ncbi:hypothetical protein [Phycicoccus sp. Soil803]|uniref:hypothetical protein n=1 Tax=Phycicoccus sp. Soil803 TaxID=1736415 RepID=UPI000A990B16|nr:hypothetical protein [Phycicoccus sp. Soil803]